MVQILRVNILLLYIIWIFLVPSHGLKIHPAQEGEGRTLRVTTRYYEPFMYRDQFDKGIDFKLIKTIAEKEHMELKLHFDDNLITTGFNRLLKNNSDILIGGIFPNFTNLHPSTSIIYQPYHDELIWCTQKAKYFPFLINIFVAATPECWLLVIFGMGYGTGLILYIFIQFDLKYEKRNQFDWHYTTCLIALPSAVGGSQLFYPKYLPLRIFYAVIFFGMFFNWQIVMLRGVRFLREPVQRHQISTVTEIIDEDFRLAGSVEVSNLIAFDDRYYKSQIDSFLVCPTIGYCLEQLKRDDNWDLVIGGSRQHILNSRSYSPSEIFCFDRDENIATYQPVLLMRGNFPLKLRIEKIMQNAFESGLFIKWHRDNQRKKETALRYTPPPQITLKEYTFMFFVIGFGCFFATSSLICEIIIDRKRKRTTRGRVWFYLEQFFDGKRYYMKNLPESLMKKDALCDAEGKWFNKNHDSRRRMKQHHAGRNLMWTGTLPTIKE